MIFDLLIRGDRQDLGVQGGKIAALLAPGTDIQAKETLDARGLLVLPGVIDTHVHFRTPGLTHKEDFLSGSAAAAAGGVSTVCDMPNTVPPVTTAAILQEKAALIRSHVDYGLYGVITPESLPHLEEMAAAGIIAYKLFLGPTTGLLKAPPWGELVAVFRRVAATGLPLVVHAEDWDVVEHWEATIQATGRADYAALLDARPPFSEALAVAGAILLAEQTGVRLHIAHMNTKETVDLLAWAKARGLSVTGETCPQYLFLSAEDYPRLGPLLKLLPLIRHKEDQERLWQGLRDGTIDTVTTDHAPHLLEEKLAAPDIWAAPAGVIGVETLLPLMATAAAEGRIAWPRLAEAVSSRPAEIFGLRGKGRLEVGMDADVTLLDPAAAWTIDRERLRSKGKNTPFHGFAVRGRVAATLVRGRTVFRDGEVMGRAGGEWLKPGRDGSWR